MTANQLPEHILDEAADWYDQLDSLSAEQQTQYQTWLAQNPLHVQAIGWLQKHLQAHDQALLLALEQTPPQADDNKVVALPVKAPRRWTSLAVAASVLLGCALIFSQLRQGGPAAVVADQPLATAAGEVLSQALADGSAISLAAATRLHVRLQPDRREVVLHEGEAFFEVAPDKERPFTVDAGSVQVRVLGTGFDVDRSAGGVAVEVAHGRVEVSWEGEKHILLAGDALRVRDGRAELYHGDHVASWREGWRNADNEALSVTLEHLQRYSQRPIRTEDLPPGLHFSGRYRTQDVEGTLHLIAGLFGLQLNVQPDALVLAGADGTAR